MGVLTKQVGEMSGSMGVNRTGGRGVGVNGHVNRTGGRGVGVNRCVNQNRGEGCRGQWACQ